MGKCVERGIKIQQKGREEEEEKFILLRIIHVEVQ